MNQHDLKLFIVEGPEVRPGQPNEEWEGTDRLLIAATNPDAAIEVACHYDEGRTIKSRLNWHGQMIDVISFTDPDTELFL